jgi:indolepyruvate ferredoxin oxidoreductase beta subunit
MKDDKVKSILFAGVGGQGILRASDILCEVMMEAGYDVKKSEVHGMAQRGGCVTSHVRYGAKVYSPLVSFEKMEALRYLKYLSADASIILNTEQINPPAVNLGDSQYPDDIIEFLKNNYPRVIAVDALSLALKAGNLKTANVVLLGTLSSLMDIKTSIWESVIRKSFPQKLVKLNLEAFQMGIPA